LYSVPCDNYFLREEILVERNFGNQFVRGEVNKLILEKAESVRNDITTERNKTAWTGLDFF